jgi:predicted O-methyltransferase YrrM
VPNTLQRPEVADLLLELHRRARAEDVAAEVGEYLYLMTVARRPSTVVEFGASHGVSTLYLAAALRDVGAGRLISTEILPDRAVKAREHLGRAGLKDIVEIREGDALDHLHDLPGDVGLVMLDGRNAQYVPVLELIAPKLAAEAVVLADLGHDDPDLLAYQRHVRAPGSGLFSVEVPLGHGLDVSVRVG